MTASYAPGQGVALIGPRCWALLGVTSGNPVVEALWPAIQSDAPLTELLDLLLHKGLSDLPSFALAHWEKELRLVVRGDAVVHLGEAEEALELVAGHLVSWFEYAAASEPSLVRMSLPGAALDVPAFPSVGGVMLADRLEVRGLAAAATVIPEPPASDAPVPVPSVADLVATSSPESVQAESEPDAALEEVADDVDSGGLPEHSDQTLNFQAELLAEVLDLAPEPAVEAEPDGPSYDHLFGETINRVPEVVAPDPAPQLLTPPVASAPALVERLSAPPTAHAASAPPSGGLIDAVPWAPASPEPQAPAPSAASAVSPQASAPLSSFAPAGGPEPELDERTTRRGDLEALVRAQAALADRLGPVVHAVSCPKGHLNDPQSGACRICRSALSDQDPVTVPRPVLGTLRLSTGDLVTLDRGVLLGRSPSTAVEGVDKPHLVKLTSPGNEISRNHVSIELDGWHILVRDLKTTNGTMVQLPGEEPQRLRPEDPQPITPGSVVTLADGVSFTFEVES